METLFRQDYPDFRVLVVDSGSSDGTADWVRTQAVELESEPQEYSYLPGYYAVFFYDPDGLKLEIVHVPGLIAA